MCLHSLCILYAAGVYTHDDEQLRIAKAVDSEHAGSVVEIKPADTFWPAEVYHQQYLEKVHIRQRVGSCNG
jgi:peptide methionine sulfoxide reductase MsrA